jgi:hypothetical protein
VREARSNLSKKFGELKLKKRRNRKLVPYETIDIYMLDTNSQWKQDMKVPITNTCNNNIFTVLTKEF